MKRILLAKSLSDNHKSRVRKALKELPDFELADKDDENIICYVRPKPEILTVKRVKKLTVTPEVIEELAETEKNFETISKDHIKLINLFLYNKKYSVDDIDKESQRDIKEKIKLMCGTITTRENADFIIKETIDDCTESNEEAQNYIESLANSDLYFDFKKYKKDCSQESMTQRVEPSQPKSHQKNSKSKSIKKSSTENAKIKRKDSKVALSDLHTINELFEQEIRLSQANTAFESDDSPPPSQIPVEKIKQKQDNPKIQESKNKKQKIEEKPKTQKSKNTSMKLELTQVNLSQKPTELSQKTGKTSQLSKKSTNLSLKTVELSQKTIDLSQKSATLSQKSLTAQKINFSQKSAKLSQKSVNSSQKSSNLSQKSANSSQKLLSSYEGLIETDHPENHANPTLKQMLAGKLPEINNREVITSQTQKKNVKLPTKNQQKATNSTRQLTLGDMSQKNKDKKPQIQQTINTEIFPKSDSDGPQSIIDMVKDLKSISFFNEDRTESSHVSLTDSVMRFSQNPIRDEYSDDDDESRSITYDEMRENSQSYNAAEGNKFLLKNILGDTDK